MPDDDELCPDCRERRVDCQCVPPVIAGQEELFPKPADEDEPTQRGGPAWA
jgi:hypothetical protein